MRERWASETTSRAAAFWTAARRKHLLGDKHLLLDPIRDAPLLRAMSLVQRDGSMNADALKKLMQVNQLVALLEPLFLDLAAAHPIVRVVDAGAGRSYLTLLVGWCFQHLWKHPAQILGVEQQAVLVRKSQSRTAMAELADSVRFATTALGDLDLATAWRTSFDAEPGTPAVHALVALHACDTATDDALALGVRAGASVIAVVPCCQAELAALWATLAEQDLSTPLEPLIQSPHLRREAGATFTDALRVLVLRACGYRVTAMEGIPGEHSPKSTLLRAVREGSAAHAALARAEYLALRHACGDVDLALARALADWQDATGRYGLLASD